MVKITKIYTRTGDQGDTSLVDGSSTRKDGARVAAYGDIDELNASLGVAICICQEHKLSNLVTELSDLQQKLFDFGAEIATPENSKYPCPVPTTETEIADLESRIDEITANLPELRSFVLPGGHPLTAQLHVSRTICRRAERSLVTLMELETVSPLTLQFINRLSDYLFALSRHASQITSTPEVLWDSRRNVKANTGQD